MTFTPPRKKLVDEIFLSAKDILVSTGCDISVIEEAKKLKYIPRRNFPEALNSRIKQIEQGIENSTVGDPSWSAYYLVKYCQSSKKWAKKIIENDTIGDVAMAAYYMVLHFKVNREWAEKMIEKVQIKNKVFAAGLMVRYCGSSKEWYGKIKDQICLVQN